MAYDNLRRVMNERNLSTRRLAIMSGIVPQSLYAALAGKTKMWPGYMRKISDALQIDEAILFGDDIFTNLNYISNLGGFIQVESGPSDSTTVIRFDSAWLNEAYRGI